MDGIISQVDGIRARTAGIISKMDGTRTRTAGIISKMDGTKTRTVGIISKMDGIRIRTAGIINRMSGEQPQQEPDCLFAPATIHIIEEGRLYRRTGCIFLKWQTHLFSAAGQ